MSKRPWMPLYAADYLADTGHLTVIEHGAYLLLIMHYWVNDGLPADEGQLRNIAKLSPHNWKKSRETLQKLFEPGWKHKRVEEELEKAREISGKRADAAKKRHEKGDASASANAVQMQTHSQSQSQDSSFIQGGELFDSPPVSRKPKIRLNEWPRDYRDQFWERWPDKRAKKPAVAALERVHAADAVPFEAILTGVENYMRTKPPDRDWMLATTFLNQERWNDEPSSQTRRPAERGNGEPRGASAVDAGVRAVQDFIARRANGRSDVTGRHDAELDRSQRHAPRDLDLSDSAGRADGFEQR